MSSVTSTITTAEQLLAARRELGRGELVRGEYQPMSPAGGRHGNLANILGFLLTEHVRRHQLGRVYAAETGFVLERNPDTVRAPDVAFIAAARLAQADTPGFIPIAPDVVGEVLSPDDRADAVAEKTQWWLSHGVKLVWIVDPRTQTVTAYEPDGHARVAKVGQQLDAGDAVPGFKLDLSELFAPLR